MNKMQAIPSLKDKVEKINKEKVYCLKHITKLQEEVDEREDECKQLKATVAELKDTSVSMRETYEYTIRVGLIITKLKKKKTRKLINSAQS